MNYGKQLLGSIVLTGFLASGLALAQSPSAGVQKEHPCKNIQMACQSAGYFKGGHKQGKGLWKDCFQKIMKGESVSSVSVNPSDVPACQARKAEHVKHNAEKK